MPLASAASTGPSAAAQLAVKGPARLQTIAATQALAQEQQPATPVQAPSSQTSAVPQPVVQQMEAEIAKLQAKVQSLEQPGAAAGGAAPAGVQTPARIASVAVSSPVQTKDAAEQRLVAKAAAPLAASAVDDAPAPAASISQRAASAVDKLISARTAGSGPASDRAASMVNSLIAGRLAQKEGANPATSSRGAEQTRAAARDGSAGGFSIKGAYGP